MTRPFLIFSFLIIAFLPAFACVPSEGYVLLSGRIEGTRVRLYPPVWTTKAPGTVKPGNYRLDAYTEKGLTSIFFDPVKDAQGGLSFQLPLPALPKALRIYRGSILLLSLQVTSSFQEPPNVQLKEEEEKILLTWEGARYANLIYVALDGTRTTLALWHTGGRLEVPTDALPPGGHFEVQLSNGLNLCVLTYPR